LAIVNGDEKTGVTVMKLMDKMDAGDIISQAEIAITQQEDAQSLRTKLAQLGMQLLVKTVDEIAQGTYTLAPQDEGAATLAPKLTKEVGHIDWSKSAADIHNLVRGLIPWPIAYTHYKNKFLRILKTEVVDSDASVGFGEVIEVNKSGFVVATGQKALLVKEVQLESSKRMDANSFVLGHKLEAGSKFEGQA